MANDWLKAQRRRMHLCTECGAPTEMKSDGSFFPMCEDCRDKKRDVIQGTLCWKCRNAVPDLDGETGCRWSRYKKPVNGWEATPTRLKVMGDKTVQSYFVRECPEFKEG